MRILHTSDWHLGKALEGRSRLAEQAAFLDELTALCTANAVDLVLVTGDVFDSGNPPAQAETLFYDALTRLTQGGERVVVVLAGNHDSPERLAAASPIARTHGILLVGLPKTVVPVGPCGAGYVQNSGEGFLDLALHGERVVLLTLPYPTERRLAEVLSAELADDQAPATFEARLSSLFEQLSCAFTPGAIRLVAAHLYTVGSEPAGSERGAQLGGAYRVSADIFPSSAQYVALGHIHKPQAVPGTSGRARYAGSPMPYHRDEIGGAPKSVALIDATASGDASVRLIPLSVYKPLEIWRCPSVQAALEQCEARAGTDAYVYLEIETNTPIAEGDMRRMRKAKADILEITPCPTGENDFEPAQAPLISRGFDELFRDYYASIAHAPAPEALLTLLGELLEEADDEADQPDA